MPAIKRNFPLSLRLCVCVLQLKLLACLSLMVKMSVHSYLPAVFIWYIFGVATTIQVKCFIGFTTETHNVFITYYDGDPNKNQVPNSNAKLSLSKPINQFDKALLLLIILCMKHKIVALIKYHIKY